MANLTLYPGGGYKSNTTVTSTEMKDVSAADSAMQILGNNNVLQKEESVQMADGSKIVGGDVAETLSTQIKAGGDLVSGYKVGNNSSMFVDQMDSNTKEILDQALTIVGANSNNFLALSAGRDPDSSLPDESVEVSTTGKFDAVKAWLKTSGGKSLAVGIIAAGMWLIFKKRGRK